MPNTLSQTALQEVLSEEMTDRLLECLTFEHSEFSEKVRLVNDKTDLERSTGTFTAFPFNAQLPDNQDEGMPAIEVVADLVDRQVLQQLRALSVDDPPKVTYEAVLESQPDTVEYGPLQMELENIASDQANRMTLRVSFERDFLGDSFPKDIMSPSAVKNVVQEN